MKSFVDRLHEKFASSAIHNNTVPDISEWQSFLDSLKKSNDCFDVAYNKYLCRMHLFPKHKRVLMNFLGFGAFFVVLIYLIASNKPLSPMKKGVAVLERARDIPSFDDVVPEDIFGEYDKVLVSENFNKKFGILCKEARTLYIRCVKKHPLSFFFNYFVYMELAAHSHFLLEYNPEATIVYINERNVASPIITELYEQGGRKFISFMHGEYLLQLIQAYMKFSRYYVWDASYIDMFSNDLNCQIKEYVVYTPKKLQKKWELEKIEPTYFCTYYFSGESEKSIINIAQIFNYFQQKGKKCKVRPHPRDVQNLKEILSRFEGVEVEDSNVCSLHDSLAKTEYVVGLASTVLSEAFAEGKKIVLDDVSDPESFQSLSERKFVVLRKEHLLLSKIQKLVMDDNYK